MNIFSSIKRFFTETSSINTVDNADFLSEKISSAKESYKNTHFLANKAGVLEYFTNKYSEENCLFCDDEIVSSLICYYKDFPLFINTAIKTIQQNNPSSILSELNEAMDWFSSIRHIDPITQMEDFAHKVFTAPLSAQSTLFFSFCCGQLEAQFEDLSSNGSAITTIPVKELINLINHFIRINDFKLFLNDISKQKIISNLPMKRIDTIPAVLTNNNKHYKNTKFNVTINVTIYRISLTVVA